MVAVVRAALKCRWCTLKVPERAWCFHDDLHQPLGVFWYENGPPPDFDEDRDSGEWLDGYDLLACHVAEYHEHELPQEMQDII